MRIPSRRGTAALERFAAHRPEMYRLALSWCGDPMLADDLAQEAMAKAMAKQHQLREVEKTLPWLFRILNNCWKEHLRRRHPFEDIDELVLSHSNTPETGLRQAQVIDRVRAAIQRLPLGQRQVVTLVDLQEMTYADVALVLDIPIGTVMSRLSRARTTLRAMLLSLEGEFSPERCHLRRVK